LKPASFGGEVLPSKALKLIPSQFSTSLQDIQYSSISHHTHRPQLPGLNILWSLLGNDAAISASGIYMNCFLFLYDEERPSESCQRKSMKLAAACWFHDDQDIKMSFLNIEILSGELHGPAAPQWTKISPHTSMRKR
jgi:hypothetical protein